MAEIELMADAMPKFRIVLMVITVLTIKTMLTVEAVLTSDAEFLVETV